MDMTQILLRPPTAARSQSRRVYASPNPDCNMTCSLRPRTNSQGPRRRLLSMAGFGLHVSHPGPVRDPASRHGSTSPPRREPRPGASFRPPVAFAHEHPRRGDLLRAGSAREAATRQLSDPQDAAHYGQPQPRTRSATNPRGSRSVVCLQLQIPRRSDENVPSRNLQRLALARLQ